MKFAKQFKTIALCLAGCVVVSSLWAGVAGEKKPSPNTPMNPQEETRYRGFTVHRLKRKDLEEALRKYDINMVRYMIAQGLRREVESDSLKDLWAKLMKRLPGELDMARQLGLAVVIDLHSVFNDNPKKAPRDPDPIKSRNLSSETWWNDENNLRLMLESWRDIAKICADRDQVIWFDIFNEPLYWPTVHSHPSYPPKWPGWAQQIINEIRKYDKKHPVVVEPGPGMLCWGFRDFPPLKDPYRKVIYSLHMWQPIEYTHQGIHGYTKTIPWSEGGVERIEKELAPAIEFQKKHGVQIYVGEFGVARWAPGAARYLQDCLTVFEKYGWDWTYHSYREFGAWELDIGGTKEKPIRHKAKFTDRGKVIQSYLKRNQTEKEKNTGK